MSRRKRRAWILLGVWTCLTAVALLVPLDRQPRVLEQGLDKVAHTGMFTVLGVLAQAAAPWFSLLLGLPVAVGLELVQKKLPYRTFDPVELWANVAGVLVGIGCFEAAVRLGRR